MRVVVIGQGYVGLPLAVRAVEVGFDVVGFDIDAPGPSVFGPATRSSRTCPTRRLQSMLGSGRFPPSRRLRRRAGFDIAVITVPTPLREGAPDLGYIEDSAALARAARATRLPPSSWSPPPIPGRPRSCSSRCSRRAAGSRPGRTSTSATAPSASTRATRRWHLREHAQGRVRHRRGLADGGAGLLRPARGHRPCRCRRPGWPS